mgnify:FL=1
MTTVDLPLDGLLERYVPTDCKFFTILFGLVPYLFTNGKSNLRRATNLHITPGHAMTNRCNHPLGGFVDLRKSNSTPIDNKGGGEVNDFSH